MEEALGVESSLLWHPVDDSIQSLSNGSVGWFSMNPESKLHPFSDDRNVQKWKHSVRFYFNVELIGSSQATVVVPVIRYVPETGPRWMSGPFLSRVLVEPFGTSEMLSAVINLSGRRRHRPVLSVSFPMLGPQNSRTLPKDIKENSYSPSPEKNGVPSLSRWCRDTSQVPSGPK